ncbi:PHKG [Mytilus edulis]|uniref:phosphorylase kinase n=1 Tax=Mytilus edulis TaxID=6550 RepID=A0A8S3Q138_MYTED|nr:PHKG [Mytilus edulis]
MGKQSVKATDTIQTHKLSNGHISVPKELRQLLETKDKVYDQYSKEFTTSQGTSQFRLEEICGVGISSIVRRCVSKDTGQEYAVKIIDISGEKAEDFHADQTKLETIREINILKMCDGHPNIINLHDSFQTPTFIFLVFELCKQGELFDYLTQVVTLSEKRTRIIMKQLLEAVEFIHNKNIVHRDLKPENILLDDNLNIKLSDFGFATVLGPEEELTELCGTPGYLAPEVLAVSMYENVPGYRLEVDMWAIGVIMYTLLCGAPPFWHRKQMQMLRMIMEAKYSFGTPEWDDISQPPKDLLKPEKQFYPRKVFKAAVICVNFFYRLRFYFNNPPPISREVIKSNPYSVKIFRKHIDACAFKMYGHWVKRGDNQNRAALFEHAPRDDWKNVSVNTKTQLIGIKSDL